jgi:hypothetical protein
MTLLVFYERARAIEIGVGQKSQANHGLKAITNSEYRLFLDEFLQFFFKNIFEFQRKNLSTAQVISEGESAWENHRLIIVKAFWIFEEFIDVNFCGSPASKLNRSCRLIFAVNAVTPKD